MGLREAGGRADEASGSCVKAQTAGFSPGRSTYNLSAALTSWHALASRPDHWTVLDTHPDIMATTARKLGQPNKVGRVIKIDKVWSRRADCSGRPGRMDKV